MLVPLLRGPRPLLLRSVMLKMMGAGVGRCGPVPQSGGTLSGRSQRMSCSSYTVPVVRKWRRVSETQDRKTGTHYTHRVKPMYLPIYSSRYSAKERNISME